MLDILFVIIGFMLGFILMDLFMHKSEVVVKKDCTLHKWVMNDVQNELRCSVCNKTPGDILREFEK